MDIHAFCKFTDIFLRNDPLHFRIIRLIYMLFRGKQPMRQFPVIGDQQQPFGIFIQTSYRKQILSFAGNNQVDHRLFSGILCCRNHPGGLVQHIIFFFCVADGLTVEYNGCLFGIDLCFRLFHTSAIHRHSAFGNRPLYFCSCAHSHICEIFIQSYLHLFSSL